MYYKNKYIETKQEYLRQKNKYKTKYKLSQFEEEKLKTELKRLFKKDKKKFKVSYKLYKIIYELFGYEFQQVFGKSVSQYLVLKLIIKLYNNKVNIARIIRYTNTYFDENQIGNPSYLINFIKTVQKKNKLNVFTTEEIQEIMDIIDESDVLTKLQEKQERQKREEKQSKQMERNFRRYRNKYEYQRNYAYEQSDKYMEPQNTFSGYDQSRENQTKKDRKKNKLKQCKPRPVDSREDKLINFLIRHEIIPCQVSEEFITVFKGSFKISRITKVTRSLTLKVMNPLFRFKIKRVLIWETLTFITSVILQLSLLGGGIYSVYRNLDWLKERFGKYIPITNK